MSASVSARSLPRTITLAQILLLTAILAAALLARAWFDTAPDVSWLLTLGEKLLAGERPYIDFIEINPPASIYIYLPAILLARLSGISPEFAVGFLVFAGVAVSLWICARMLIEAGILRADQAWWAGAVFTVVLLVLPARTFAQREHIALIAFLPMIAVSTLRAEGKSVALCWAVIAGIGAGLTVAIKPHFVFPVLFTVGAAALCARSWRPVFAIENWISASLAVAYAAGVVMIYPAFVHDLIPMIMTVYVSQKASWFDLLTLGAVPFWCGALLVVVVLKRNETFAPPFVLLLAASAGFLISFALQQKGLNYQSYPMLALIFAAAMIALFDRAPALKNPRLLPLACAAVLAAIFSLTFSWYSSSIVDLHSLIVPIEASVSRPKILNIAGVGLVDVGFPLTRQLHGTWVGRTCGQWITAGAVAEKTNSADPETIARLDRYMTRDRDGLIEDIARKKPDIILVDRIRNDWLKWAKSSPALMRELAHYRELVDERGVLVLRRKKG
jgi:hypothetical protein